MGGVGIFQPQVFDLGYLPRQGVFCSFTKKERKCVIVMAIKFILSVRHCRMLSNNVHFFDGVFVTVNWFTKTMNNIEPRRGFQMNYPSL